MKDQAETPSIRQRIDNYLDRKAEKFILASVERYAQDDVALANRIRWELTRRSELGKRLDIHEPIRWTAVQTGLSFVMGAAIKAFTDKKFSGPALWTLAISTVLMNSIQLARLLPRYQQGLDGALDTAISMHKKAFPFDPFTKQSGVENSKTEFVQQEKKKWVNEVAIAPEERRIR